MLQWFTSCDLNPEKQVESTADPEARAPNSGAAWRQPGACPPKPWRRGAGNLIVPAPELRKCRPVTFRHPLRRRLGALMTSLRPPQTGSPLTPNPFSVAAPRAMPLRLHFV